MAWLRDHSHARLMAARRGADFGDPRVRRRSEGAENTST